MIISWITNRKMKKLLENISWSILRILIKENDITMKYFAS